MKLEITHTGARDLDGKKLSVGDVVEIKGDKVPGHLVNKCKPVGRVAVTNPAKSPAPDAAKKPD